MTLLHSVVWGQTSFTPEKPRLIVLTDISSLSQGEGEPDDGQSIIRLMLYSNVLDLEGLIATSNMRHGDRTRPELIKKVVDTYGRVHPNLTLHNDQYPTPARLSTIIKRGLPIAGPKIPVDECVGEGKDTEASDWIITVVEKEDPRPVWVAIWGGSADLAQALWKVRSTRTPDQVKEFVSKLRVHTVYDQDATGPWMREQFPELYCILRHHGIRGMYRGGDTTLVRSRWVQTNIRNHGALGDLYVDYKGGDIWGRQLGRVCGIKEGDTPSFLYLLTNGLNAPAHPEWGNWAGRFKKIPGRKNLWVEDVDSIANFEKDMDPRMAALYRWRPAWQADFAARLDWCVKSFSEANHPPDMSGATIKTSRARAGKTVKLSPPKASDPDGDDLHYKWYVYPEEGSYRGNPPDLRINGMKASFTTPEVSSPQTIHVILEVTDNGEPALTAYRRFIVTVEPD